MSRFRVYYEDQCVAVACQTIVLLSRNQEAVFQTVRHGLGYRADVRTIGVNVRAETPSSGNQYLINMPQGKCSLAS